MLLLTRREDERIVVRDDVTGDEIEIVIVRLWNDKVSVGFEADRKYTIYRKELEGKRNRRTRGRRDFRPRKF